MKLVILFNHATNALIMLYSLYFVTCMVFSSLLSSIVSQYNYMGQNFSTNTDAGPYLDCGALSRKKTVTFIT